MIELTEIEKQDRKVRIMNREYWQSMIPELRRAEKRIGYQPKVLKEKAEQYYKKLEAERARLGELKNGNNKIT